MLASGMFRKGGMDVSSKARMWMRLVAAVVVRWWNGVDLVTTALEVGYCHFYRLARPVPEVKSMVWCF